jgi:hypothetical protein
MLDRIVAMLTKLGGRGYSVNEELAAYADSDADPEIDADTGTN